jgi:hypothetical protein
MMGVPAAKPVVSDPVGPISELNNYQSHKSDLAALLAYPLSAGTLQTHLRSRLPYFFVRGDYSSLRSRVDPLHHELKNSGFSAPLLPSKPDLTALAANSALSLFSILRLHLTFKYLSSDMPDLSIKLKIGETPCIPEKSIIPSLRYVDPTVVSKCRADRDVGEFELIASMNLFLERLMEVHRGEAKLFPMFFFSQRLEKGEPLGGSRRKKDFRITTACAMAICHAFSGSSDPAQLKREADMLFPEDGSLGPGKGMYTVALPPSNGNQIYFYG